MDKNVLDDVFDSAILRHGFTEYNRDYEFLVEIGGISGGQHRLIFSHVYELSYTSTINDATLKQSLDDDFIDYQQWQSRGEPDGFVWGVNYSIAYPGFSIKINSEKANVWSNKLCIAMYEIHVATEAFKVEFVCHNVQLTKLNNNQELISRLSSPLKSFPG